METKLTDFTSEQLSTLEKAVTARMMDREQHAEHYVRHQMHDLQPFKKSYDDAMKEAAICVDLLVQITHAYVIVKGQETVNAN
jgi:hypothetical protein